MRELTELTQSSSLPSPPIKKTVYKALALKAKGRCGINDTWGKSVIWKDRYLQVEKALVNLVFYSEYPQWKDSFVYWIKAKKENHNYINQCAQNTKFPFKEDGTKKKMFNSKLVRCYH